MITLRTRASALEERKKERKKERKERKEGKEGKKGKKEGKKERKKETLYVSIIVGAPYLLIDIQHAVHSRI